MATLQEVERALVNADKAGDTDAAKQLAAEVTRIRGMQGKRVNIKPTVLDRAMANRDLNDIAGRGSIPTVSQNDPAAAFGSGGRFMAGAGKAITDVGRGAGQRVGIYSQADIDEAMRLDKPLMETTAGQAGNVGGNLAVGLPTLAVPGANTVLGAGAFGLGLSALSPTTSDQSVGNNMAAGAMFGGGTSAAVRGLPMVAKSLVDPFYEGGRRKIVARTLERFGVRAGPAATAETPGWEPTLAQATRNPGISILERGAASASPDIAAELYRRQLEQNAAAVGTVRRIGGSEQQMDMAKALRQYMTKGFYDEAASKGIDPKVAASLAPQISNLLERPSVKMAIKRAEGIMDEKSMAKVNSGSVEGLQLVKQALDDAIESASRQSSSIGKNQLSALRQTRSDLINALDELSPAQRTADRNYATFSRPINEMEVGRALEEKLVPALMHGENVPPKLRAEGFANALRSLDEKIPGMTGYQGSTVENTLTGPNLRAIEAVRRDLSNRAASSEAARGVGSNTAQNLSSQNILEQTLGPIGMPRNWSQAIAASTIGRTASSPLGLIYNRAAEPNVREELARALLDPQYARRLLRQANTPLAGEQTLRLANAGLGLIPPGVVGSRNAQQ
jgi:hypothetical protein